MSQQLAHNVDQLEATMLTMEQADCPVTHYFGPGLWVRQVTMPAGTIAIGHAQRLKHLNVMIAGKVAMVTPDGVKVLEAPLTFVGQPGRKVGYIIETVVWQNIYATEETDIDKLEAHFLDKSDTYQMHAADLDMYIEAEHQCDRDDFALLLEQSGFTAAQVREQSENTEDQIQLPREYMEFLTVRDSQIHGRGLFVTWPVPAGTRIAPARIDGLRTEAGRYVNHAIKPNCHYEEVADVIWLVASEDLNGCKGGSKGEELTVNYRQALALQGVTCQE